MDNPPFVGLFLWDTISFPHFCWFTAGIGGDARRNSSGLRLKNVFVSLTWTELSHPGESVVLIELSLDGLQHFVGKAGKPISFSWKWIVLYKSVPGFPGNYCIPSILPSHWGNTWRSHEKSSFEDWVQELRGFVASFQLGTMGGIPGQDDDFLGSILSYRGMAPVTWFNHFDTAISSLKSSEKLEVIFTVPGMTPASATLGSVANPSKAIDVIWQGHSTFFAFFVSFLKASIHRPWSKMVSPEIH